MSSSDRRVEVSDVYFALTVPDWEESARTYRILLGHPGSASGFSWRNGRLELREAGASTIDFAADDLDRAVTLFGRRGLPGEIRGDRYALTGREPFGVAARTPAPTTGAQIDHIVLTHPDVDGAVAFYSGRLGMDLRLVKPVGDGLTQLFFRTLTVIVEVIAGPSMADRPRNGGVAWLVSDLDAEHSRLTEAGLALSEVRIGRKKGTRVCTVREKALGMPTLLIEQEDLA